MIPTCEELVNITKGKWRNLNDDLSFIGISFTVYDLQKQNIFIPLDEDEASYVIDELEEVKKKGAVAIVTDNINFNTTLPTLVVEDANEAFKNIAIAIRDKTDAKRVLVTGSYGKTGFKVRLYQLIKAEQKVRTIINSANMDFGVYRALSVANKEDQVNIIEVAGANLSKAKKRSKVVQPHICVITSIGYEHLYRTKTINNTIYNKSSVVKYLEPNGICIIQKDKYFTRMKENIIEHNPNTIIKVFGEDDSCDAYVIYKEFNNFGWDVKANIEGEILEYRVPFPEIHSIKASLSEFLCAKLLGVELKNVVKRYKYIKNFQSSGKLYEVKIDEKKFLLYDQSHRGGIENYESFFETLSYIKPKNYGRKIVFTSEFVDYEDNEMDNIDANSFQKLISDAKIDALFTVEKFSEHIDVLKDKTIWKKHSFDYENMKDVVLDFVRDDDILCVKGIFESQISEFIRYISLLPNVTIEYKS